MSEKPPRGLSRQAQQLWKRLTDEFDFDDAGLILLLTCLQAHDRMIEARKILKLEGLVSKDRWGQPRVHPLTVVERDARSQFMQGLKLLGVHIPDGGK